MILHELGLEGAFLLEPKREEDSRGFFARIFDRKLLLARGLEAEIVQQSVAWNARAGTLRGMHFQLPPLAEVKFVRCTRGAIHDVIVDLRPESTTFGRNVAVQLDAESRTTLYVPARFAHGYQTLVDDTEVAYAMTTPYAPDASSGLRHDDADLDIVWPLPVTEISTRDLGLPTLLDCSDDLVVRMRLPGARLSARE